MSIVSLTDVLSFLDISEGFFTVDASHDVLVLTYDGGSVTNVGVDDGTYNGTELAAHLKTKIDTAFTISSTVTYSTITKLFTITVTAGHTIKYTNAGSDAGLLFGFNVDHAAALSIISDVAAGDPSEMVSAIKDGVEDWIADKCRRTFESADYSEFYDGEDKDYLQLNNYPITALTRVCIGRRYIIRVKNTSDYTSATVSVTTTGLVFTKDDTSDSTITFADYATMDAVVTAINALGSGWSAEIESSNFSNFKSSELVRTFGKNAIDGNWVYLEAPNEAIDDFEVNPDKGTLYYSLGWPEGENNIFVKYTAGYSTIPDRLKLGTKIACKHIYNKRKEELFGIQQYRISDISVTIEKGDLPKETLDIISKFRRILI